MRLCLHKLRNNLPLCFQFCKILAFKIGDADGSCFSVTICLFKLSVACKPVAGGLVDIKEVYMIYAKTLQGFIHRTFVFIFTCPELCRKKDFFSGNAAFPDASADCPLVDIGICGIHARITHFERFSDTRFSIRRSDHKSSQPDNRAFVSVVHSYIFHLYILRKNILLPVRRDFSSCVIRNVRFLPMEPATAAAFPPTQ